MLEQTSLDFRTKFLLVFTREILRNTKEYKIFEIKEEVKQSLENKGRIKIEEEKRPTPKDIKLLVKEKFKEDSKKVSELKKINQPLKKIEQPPRIIVPLRRPVPVVRIPELALPPTVSYIAPVPNWRETDLDELNPLIRDPFVRTIECNGPDQNIIVTGIMGRKNTPIVLSKEGIRDILNLFSGESRIPLQEGLFKAAVGRLVISAVFSEIAGSKFIIRKLTKF